MTAAVYNVLALDLTNAGSETLDGTWAICRFLDAEKAGSAEPTAKVTVRADRGRDPAPLRLGQAMLASDTKRFIIEWAAQAGVTATFGFSNDPQALDWDADPPSRLVTGSLAVSTADTLDSIADVELGAAATTLIAAADASRRELIIYNLAANVSTFRIGDSGAGAANGIPLPPGGTMILSTTAAVYGYNAGAAQSVAVASVEDA